VKYYDSVLRLMRRLSKLKHYKDYITIKKGIPNYDVGYSQSFKNPPKIKSVKSLEFNYSAGKEWYFRTSLHFVNNNLGLGWEKMVI